VCTDKKGGVRWRRRVVCVMIQLAACCLVLCMGVCVCECVRERKDVESAQGWIV
jgi:hypothetical protein